MNEELEILQIDVEQNSSTYLCNPNINYVQRAKVDTLLGKYYNKLQEAEPSEKISMKIQVTCDKSKTRRPRS